MNICDVLTCGTTHSLEAWGGCRTFQTSAGWMYAMIPYARASFSGAVGVFWPSGLEYNESYILSRWHRLEKHGDHFRSHDMDFDEQGDWHWLWSGGDI